MVVEITKEEFENLKDENYNYSIVGTSKIDDLTGNVIFEEQYYKEIKTSEEIAIAKKEKITTQINELKNKLAETDFRAIKYAEGLINDEEYSIVKNERENWRNIINELQKELENEY